MRHENTIWLIAGISALVLAITFCIWWDYRIWDRQKNLPANIRRHNKGWRFKAVTSIVPIFCLAQASNFIWIVALLVSVFMSMCWFALLFDGGYNIARTETFFFRGTEDGIDDAKADNFWQSLPQWLHIVLKLVLFFGSTYIYYFGLYK